MCHGWYLDRSFATLAILIAAMMLPLAHRSVAGRLALAVAPTDKITVGHSSCEGTCPEYKVTIYGDGRVNFDAMGYPYSEDYAAHGITAMPMGALLPGHHEDTIPPNLVASLFDRAEAINFFSFKQTYDLGVIDAPLTSVSVDLGNRHKLVQQTQDTGGPYRQFPEGFLKLADAVDKAAGSDRWIDGGPGLIAWLENTHFDFHSQQAAQLAAAAAGSRTVKSSFAIAMLEMGAPLDADVTLPVFYENVPYRTQKAGDAIIEAAISNHSLELLRHARLSTWLAKADKSYLAEIFSRVGAGCSPEFVDAVAAAGINIDVPGRARPGFEKEEADGMTALSRHSCLGESAVEVDRHLLQHGANPNHRDAWGRNALFGVQSLPQLALYLRAGADPKVVDHEGKSALFSVFDLALINAMLAAGADASGKSDAEHQLLFFALNDDRIVSLLKAGISPNGKDFKCETIWQHARLRKFTKTIAWLKAHPEAFRKPVSDPASGKGRCDLKSVY